VPIWKMQKNLKWFHLNWWLTQMQRFFKWMLPQWSFMHARVYLCGEDISLPCHVGYSHPSRIELANFSLFQERWQWLCHSLRINGMFFQWSKIILTRTAYKQTTAWLLACHEKRKKKKKKRKNKRKKTKRDCPLISSRLANSSKPYP